MIQSVITEPLDFELTRVGYIFRQLKKQTSISSAISSKIKGVFKPSG